jgi:RNA polymerase sigma-70 factor (ECF subfamily)
MEIPFLAVLFSLFFNLMRGVQKKCLKNLEQKRGGTEYTDRRPELMPSIDSFDELRFKAAAGAAVPAKPSEIECEVMQLFDQFRDPLLRYALSFSIPVHDAEEVVQDVFLSLFRHLQLGRSRKNLRGWLFRVTHNLALKHRLANQNSRGKMELSETIAQQQPDPSPSPEEHLSFAQRRQLLLSVVEALPESDRNCLRLRAEGLRYREIVEVLGISLGAVSISLTRSIARLVRADGR